MKKALLGLFLLCNICAAASFPTGWAWKAPLTLNQALITAGQAQFAWGINQAALPSNFWAKVKSDGGDIRFSLDYGGTQPLHYEIQSWDYGAQTCVIWIGMSTLSNTANMPYIWYGNAAATAPVANDAVFGSQGVWDANYLFVCHMEEATGTNAIDSTSNVNTSTNSNVVSDVGKIDSGDVFNGSNSCIDLGSNASLQFGLTSTYTIETWAYETSNSQGVIFGQTEEGTTPVGACFLLQGESSGISLYLVQTWGVSWSINIANASPGLNAWIHVAATSNGAGNATGINLYQGGAPAAFTNYWDNCTSWTNSSDAFIGRGKTGLSAFPGKLDEIRISNIARSADWIKTGYNNQNNLSTSATPGAPIPVGVVNTNQAFMPLLKAH